MRLTWRQSSQELKSGSLNPGPYENHKQTPTECKAPQGVWGWGELPSFRDSLHISSLLWLSGSMERLTHTLHWWRDEDGGPQSPPPPDSNEDPRSSPGGLFYDESLTLVKCATRSYFEACVVRS